MSAGGGSERAVLAPSSPGRWGAYLGIGLGVALCGLALFGALREKPLPAPLLVSLAVAGAAEAGLCWFAIQRRRVAWAFAISLSGTAALAFLFGSPRIRDAFELPLVVSVLPAAVAAAVTVLLAIAAPEI